ncbi:MAG: hypothetical protein K2P64_04830, partial [Lachnospiraceae bacterium]|nr:hypothetical protein [Lachnospiraceae bacterium]
LTLKTLSLSLQENTEDFSTLSYLTLTKYLTPHACRYDLLRLREQDAALVLAVMFFRIRRVAAACVVRAFALAVFFVAAVAIVVYNVVARPTFIIQQSFYSFTLLTASSMC